MQLEPRRGMKFDDRLNKDTAQILKCMKANKFILTCWCIKSLIGTQVINNAMRWILFSTNRLMQSFIAFIHLFVYLGPRETLTKRENHLQQLNDTKVKPLGILLTVNLIHTSFPHRSGFSLTYSARKIALQNNCT